MTKTMVVLLSPPCASVNAWARLTPLLDDLGVVSTTVQLPSCEAASDVDDATHVRATLDRWREGVVLVGHSSGGFVLTETGTHPAVKHLVYVDAIMPDAGESIAAYFGASDEEFGSCFRLDATSAWFDPTALKSYFIGRGWSADDAQGWIDVARPQRISDTVSEVTVPAWRSVTSTYISPTESEMKEHARQLFASRATDVVEIAGDHFPMWRRPTDIAEAIARVAR